MVVIDAGEELGATARAASWLRAHTARFHRIGLRRMAAEAGAAGARDLGFAGPNGVRAAARQRQRLGRAPPECCGSGGADGRGVVVCPAGPGGRYEPRRLQSGGAPGAALVAKWAWAAAGGFGAHGGDDDAELGLLCRFAELGFAGAAVSGPLLQGVATPPPALAEALRRRHPWLAAS